MLVVYFINIYWSNKPMHIIYFLLIYLSNELSSHLTMSQQQTDVASQCREDVVTSQADFATDWGSICFPFHYTSYYRSCSIFNPSPELLPGSYLLSERAADRKRLPDPTTDPAELGSLSRAALRTSYHLSCMGRSACPVGPQWSLKVVLGAYALQLDVTVGRGEW